MLSLAILPSDLEAHHLRDSLTLDSLLSCGQPQQSLCFIDRNSARFRVGELLLNEHYHLVTNGILN